MKPTELTPDDVKDLDTQKLVSCGQWVAVAAVATQCPSELGATLRCLAEACADADAFAWFWALVQRGETPDPDAGWQAFGSRP